MAIGDKCSSLLLMSEKKKHSTKPKSDTPLDHISPPTLYYTKKHSVPLSATIPEGFGLTLFVGEYPLQITVAHERNGGGD